MINGHGGNIYDIADKIGCETSEIIDMSSNINPLGPPPGLISFLRETLDRVTALPEVNSKRIIKAFAENHDVDPARILAGNGTTQFIFSIPQALNPTRAFILGPTYADYVDACIMHNVDYYNLNAEESLSFIPDIDYVNRIIKGFDAVFICNPNNPTGSLIPAGELEFLCRSYPNTYFIIDESYLPFVNRNEIKSMINCDLSNVIVLNSMSKIFSIPGLRIGFLISPPKTIEKFKRYFLPWNVNLIAQTAMLYLMNEKAEIERFIEKTVRFLETEREVFAAKFDDVPDIKFFPSKTSFILARLHGRHTSNSICSYMLQSRILLRDCSNFAGLSDRFIRISLKTREINNMLAEKLLSLFGK